MKRILLAVVLLSLLLCGTASAVPNTSAKSVILQLPDGTVLYEKNANARMLIASTTKIMTALVVLESCDLEARVKITAEAAAVEGSSMYIEPGEEYTVRELLYGLLLASGNDAAHALAVHTAGSIKAFAGLMNQKAAELGLKNSGFKNPHGLDEEGHYSTAADLAKITAAAMQNKTFREIVATKSIVIKGRSLTNHNRLLWSYDGALGVKTGYTRASGRALVSCAQRNGLMLICVTLCDPNDWNDHENLYNWAFSEYGYTTVAEKGRECFRVPVISGAEESVGVCASEDYCVLHKTGDKVDVLVRLPKFVYASVKENSEAGLIEVRINGELVKSVPLVFSESVPLGEGVKLDFWGRIKHWWYFSNSQGMPYWMYPY